jgi:HemX protein
MIFYDVILGGITILYALSCVFSFRYYRSFDEGLDSSAIRWLKIAFSLQGLSLAGEWAAHGYAPLDNLEGILTAFSFSLAAALLIGRLKTPLPVLTSLFAPFIFFVAFLAFLAGLKEIPIMDSRLMSSGMASHIFLTFLGFSHFTVGFGVGVAFWVQEGQLKHHQVKNWSYRLPALEALDQLTVFYIGLGFLFWLAGLGLGTIQAFEVWNKLPVSDPKILGSFLVLMIYACFFLLRWGFKMRGRKSMILVMAGYVLALFTFVGVRVFLTTQHVF